MSGGVQDGAAPTVIAEVGGGVDELGLTLAIYGDALDPDAVSAHLGRPPSKAHRAGDRHPRSGRLYTSGAWFAEVRAAPAVDPDEMVERLLAGMPTDPARWAELHRAYKVQLRIGVHLEAWNRGLTFSAASVARFAAMAVPMMLDIYCHCEADTH